MRHACAAVGFTILAQKPANADGKDSYVTRVLDLLRDLIEVQLAESINPSADQNDIFVPFHAVHPVERVIQRVKDVRLGEARHAQGIDRAQHRIFVLRKVDQDLGLHIIGDHGYPIVFFERAGKGIRSAQRINQQRVGCRRKLNQQNSSDRRLFHLEIMNGLRRAIFENLKIFLLQIRNELAVVSRDQDRNGHQRHVHVNGVIWHAFHLLRS